MKRILITGATGGLGQALALAYAAADTLLILSGRDNKKLDSICAKCRQKGAMTLSSVLDLQSQNQIFKWASDIDVQNPIDLVIVNAGISSSVGEQGQGENIQDVRRVFAVNSMAVFETVLPLAERMKQRGGGQIAIISSLGGIRGMPCSPSYSASKAAVRVFGQSLRSWLKPYGIKVNVVTPGFVTTPMSKRYQGSKPFMISPEKAAQIIKKGLARNKSEIAFPKILALGVKALDFLPFCIVDEILRRFFQFHVIPDKDSPCDSGQS